MFFCFSLLNTGCSTFYFFAEHRMFHMLFFAEYRMFQYCRFEVQIKNRRICSQICLLLKVYIFCSWKSQLPRNILLKFKPDWSSA